MPPACDQKRSRPCLGDTCPLEKVSLFGWLYYTWVTPFLWRAYKLAKESETIDASQVYQNPSDMKPELLADNFEQYYRDGGLKHALWSVMTWPVIKATLVQGTGMSLLIFIPIFTAQIIDLFKSGQASLSNYWLWCLTGAVSLLLLIKSVLENANVFIIFKGANQFQLGMIGAIQRKALKLSAASRQKFAGGVGINIIGVDPLRMFNMIGHIPYILVCPYHCTAAFVALSFSVGWSVFAGVASILMFFPFQFLIVKFTARYRKARYPY